MAARGNTKSKSLPSFRKTITAYLQKPRQDDSQDESEPGNVGTCVNVPPASPKTSVVVGTPRDHDKSVTSGITLLTEETRTASVSEVGLGINAQIEAHGLSVDADADVGINVDADVDVDVDADVNLEALIDTLGTEWADCKSGGEGEGEGRIPHVTSALTSSSFDMSWSTVVSRGTARVMKANSLMNNNLKSLGAPVSSSDFVIPHKLTSDWTKDHDGHGQAHGAHGMHGRGSVHIGQLGLAGGELQHKSLIKPVFLAYGRVSAET